MWTDESVQRVVEQAIKETRLHILKKAAEWHANEVRQEKNVMENTQYQAGDLRTMAAHRKSEQLFRDLISGKQKKEIPEENLGTVRRWLRRHGMDQFDVF